MEGNEQWSWVSRQARQALRRFQDGRTCALREDIAQEACVLAWQWQSRTSNEVRLGAAVQTIAKRQRARTLAAAKKGRWLQFVDFGEAACMEPCAPEVTEELLKIDGKSVPVPWAKRRLARVLRCLSALDQQLLLGFHEGFCCAELASRFGRTEDCIKTRIHRARRRVRTVFEDLVRVSNDLEEPELEEER